MCPLRVLGGISRAELNALKDRFIPVTRATTLQAIGNHVGALITAPADYALIEWMGPAGLFGTVAAADLILLGIANVNAMAFDLNMDWGAPSLGELYNVHTYAGTRNVDTLANTLTIHSFLTPLGGNLGLGDILGIRIVYNVGIPATNFYVLGAYIRWV